MGEALSRSLDFWRHRRPMLVGGCLLLLLGPASGLSSVLADVPAAPAPASALPSGLKALAPQIAPAPPPAAAAPAAAAAPSPAKPASDKQAKNGAAPVVDASADMLSKLGQLEKLMFGTSQPSIPLAYRLDRLESEVFHQTNPEWPPAQRVDRLSKILLGGGGTNGAATPAQALSQMGAAAVGMPALAPQLSPSTPLPPGAQVNEPMQQVSPYLPLPLEASSPEFTKLLNRQQLEDYGLDLINEARVQVGLKSLTKDDIAYKVAKDLVADLCKRNCAMHENNLGENPDVRYTKAGGVDCLVESVASIRLKQRPIPNKQLVYGIVKQLLDHQDDREGLLNPHASHFGFTFDVTQGGDHIIACTETVVKEAQVDPIPTTVHVGEKLDIKGRINEPYRFQKVTVAWEGMTSPPEDSDPDEEAAPFFPPLDYEAYAQHSEHDYQKAVRILQITGMGLALAGGVFMPPVALAAPLIMAAPPPKPKAVSEIPVRRGVHSDGFSFDLKLPLSKDNKEGIYYITIWAKGEVDQVPFAVSRRAVVATTGSDHVSKPEKETLQMKIHNPGDAARQDTQ
jgi:uncharacterized protein YkwD